MHAYTWFVLVMGFTWVFSLFHVDVLDGFNAPAAATNFDSNINLEEEEAGRVHARKL